MDNMEPSNMTHVVLNEMTDGFREDLILGRGTFGVVYKGEDKNGQELAVKVLRPIGGLDDKEFRREFKNLAKLKHQNIVQLVGFCNDEEEVVVEYSGKLVRAFEMHRALCFEYVHNGSLRKHLSDAREGLGWRTRYKIIKGICEGLRYLHTGLEVPVYHFDLKPENILLDKNMVPKIADFGLSRIFGEEKTKNTISSLGTPGYMPPEFIKYQIISEKFDIFSLGVIIIKTMIGPMGYSHIDEMEPAEFVEHVHNIWRKTLQLTPGYMPIEIDCQQVKTCIEVALKCLEENRHKRPSIEDIVGELSETEKNTNDPGSQIGQFHDAESILPKSDISDRPSTAQMTGAVHLALTKVDSVLRDDAAKAIIDKLSGRVTNLKELLWKVEQMSQLLKMISNVMRQIGTVYLTDELVKSWIGKVRSVAYCVEDVMDKFSYYLLQLDKEGFLNKFFIKETHYVLAFSAIADEVVEVEKEIEHVIQMWLQSSQLVPNQLTEIERQQSQDCFPEFLKDEDLVGIKENRKLLTGWLYSEEPDSTVITVSGMGGLGKTTLVSNVYEREKVNFPAHAWIVVSQIYTVDALLRRLLRKIGDMEEAVSAGIDKMDVHDLKEKIKQILQNRKCLIVLDDVWEQIVYFQVHDAFQNLLASRIIITTRKDHVAALASTTRHLGLQPLGKPDAFELFCRRAFYNKKGHTCPKEFETIATSIVDRCHGLPLAIVTIGIFLSSRPRIDVWNHICNQLWSVLSNNDHVRTILNLSYHDLSGDLRNCFLYCTLFPEDYLMSRESLVRLWVAEGFVPSTEKNTLEEVAERTLIELIYRNMIEVVESDELGRVNTCKMHAIVRNLALSVAKEERFGFGNDYGTMVQMDKAVRRLSLYGWKDTAALKVKFPRLRTLMAPGMISSSPDMISSVLSESIYLTVLELQDSEITEVPASIGNIFNLRYIGLRRTKVKSLPESIGKLSNLHTLDIKQTKIKRLPRGIVKVKKLRHLLADRFADENQSEFPYFIGVEAPKGLSGLEELQTLETVDASKDLAEQLEKLMKLQSLWIDNISATHCAKLFAVLSNMPLLSSLLLSASNENEALSFQSLKPIAAKLHRLIIRGHWATGTLQCPIFQDHGKNLKYLALSWCHLREDPLGVLALHVPNLTYLRLNNIHSAKTLILSAGSFPHLKTIVLKHMPDVNQLKIMDGALPVIEGLYIVMLPGLARVPEGIETLHSLKKLWLLDLHKDFKAQWIENEMHQKMQHVPELHV